VQRVALYIRVSTEKQKLHGLSVEAQTAALDAWAKSVGVAVAGHYVDAGISARKKADKRPALQRLLQDVREGRIDLIVFTKLDRWFRNVGEYYKVQEILDDHKVAWRAIHEDYETATAPEFGLQGLTWVHSFPFQRQNMYLRSFIIYHIYCQNKENPAGKCRRRECVQVGHKEGVIHA